LDPGSGSCGIPTVDEMFCNLDCEQKFIMYIINNYQIISYSPPPVTSDAYGSFDITLQLGNLYSGSFHWTADCNELVLQQQRGGAPLPPGSQSNYFLIPGWPTNSTASSSIIPSPLPNATVGRTTIPPNWPPSFLNIKTYKIPAARSITTTSGVFQRTGGNPRAPGCKCPLKLCPIIQCDRTNCGHGQESKIQTTTTTECICTQEITNEATGMGTLTALQSGDSFTQPNSGASGWVVEVWKNQGSAWDIDGFKGHIHDCENNPIIHSHQHIDGLIFGGPIHFHAGSLNNSFGEGEHVGSITSFHTTEVVLCS